MGTATSEMRDSEAVDGRAASWVAALGLLMFGLGLAAAVAMWFEMEQSGLGEPVYSTMDRWRAVLSALTVSGLGLVTMAVSTVTARLID